MLLSATSMHNPSDYVRVDDKQNCGLYLLLPVLFVPMSTLKICPSILPLGASVYPFSKPGTQRRLIHFLGLSSFLWSKLTRMTL